MGCFQCKNQLGLNAIVINSDGDMVCSVECQKKYEEDRDFFLDTVVNSDAKMDAWWEGKSREEILLAQDALNNEASIHKRLKAIQ